MPQTCIARKGSLAGRGWGKPNQVPPNCTRHPTTNGSLVGHIHPCTPKAGPQQPQQPPCEGLTV
eukprot:12576210-Alexandrium_andersonii.AAC.1